VCDLGQEEELSGLNDKAIKTGASKLYIEDLKEEFITELYLSHAQGRSGL